MTLVEHLDELRSRIIVVVVSIVLAGVAGFILAEPVVEILRRPLPDDTELLTLTIGESFGVRLRIALVLGIALSMPVILYELWRFVTPGLTARERRLIWPMLIAAILLFAVGLVLGYLILPFALEFLLGFALPGVDASGLRLSEYIGFVSTVLLAFALAFQFPIVLLLLARIGILSYGFLSARRRWAVLVIVVFAIIATPGGDPISSALLSLVMYVLFELTLQLIRITRR